jgi:hypothetical protein
MRSSRLGLDLDQLTKPPLKQLMDGIVGGFGPRQVRRPEPNIGGNGNGESILNPLG